MTTHDRVRQQLHALETLLREHRHWRQDAAGAPVYQHPTIFLWIPWNRWNGCNGY